MLDEMTALKIIPQLATAGVKAINWTGGGEPLTNRAFVKIADCARRHGIQQGIFTNGALMGVNDMPYLLDSHQWIRFSIDAGTRETYQRIKHSDDFDRVIEKVKTLVNLRNSTGSKVEIGIGFVITEENYHEIPQFSELIKETGVDYGQYKPSIENNLFNAEFWTDKVKGLLEEAFKTNSKAVINLYKFNDIVESNLDQPYPVCYGHQFCPCIDADAEVWACNQLRGMKEFSFGNLREQTFEEIWKGKRRQEVIAKIKPSECPKLCKNNEINKILYKVKHPSNDLHHNFL